MHVWRDGCGEKMAEKWKETDDLPPLLERLFEEEIERFVLPNGVTVLLREDHSSKLVSAQVWVKTGSIHEGENLGAGLSHFLEHMLFKGTEKREGSEISREVQAAGGYINAYTTFDHTVFYIDLPSESVSLAIDVLADATFNSTLPGEEVEKEKEVILREIDMSMDDPDRTVSRALFRNAYRQHPYQYPVIGHREVFETVNLDDLGGYYKSRYVSNNVVLVVVGDFESATLRSLIGDTFGNFTRRRLASPYIVEEPSQLAMREEHIVDEVNICRGGLGFKSRGLTHPDAPAIDMLAAVLGGGNSSLLWKRLRDEKKLVHYIEASSWCPASSGLFWISYLCDEDKREAAQAGILEEIAKIARQGLSSRHLEKAKRQALVGEVNIRKTMSGQASRLGLSEVVVGDIGYPRNYFRRLHGVTAEALVGHIYSYLTLERLTAVSLNGRHSSHGRRILSSGGAVSADFESISLSNKARLLFYRDDRLPKVNLRVVARGGPLYEDTSQRGVTGILATLLTRDTEMRNAAEVAEAIEEVGGTLGEFAGNNTFGLSLEVMPQDIDLALELLEAALLLPSFKKETFEQERDAQVASLREDMDEIVEVGKRRLRKLFFGEHPYNTDSYGTIESLNELDEAMVRDQYAKLITGSNVVFSVAGQFDREAHVSRFGELLEKLPERPFNVQNPGFEGPPKTGEFEEHLDREQAVVFQAYPDTGITEGEYHHGELLVELLSEMSGELFLQVRERRSLAYFVGATRMSGVDTGMFYFYAGTHPGAVDDVFEEFGLEIKRIQEGRVSEEELKRCQSRLKAQKRMGLQTIGYCAMQAALNAIYGLPVNDWKQYDERIDSVTADDLQRFGLEHFSPEKCVKLVVKP